ncbi:MAG: peroxiredoxin [Alphaproteobacteria bacterium]|nr:MAG: peroxiredoxin [Alphaproteobacteria bacterium]
MSRLVGNTAPDFTTDAVINGEIKSISLHKDFAGKWKVLYFYPLDFTFVCPTEITAFEDSLSKFKELNCEVIGCSVDSAFSHLAWTQIERNKGGLGKMQHPLAADLSKSIARSYEVLANEAVALRGVFVIDDKNIVQTATVNNLSVGRNVEEILRTVEAYQYTAKHGEVCPAGWTKGAATMKPDPKGSQEYFNKLK